MYGAYYYFKKCEKIEDGIYLIKAPAEYIFTHTPLGYENLENNKVMDLDNPPKIIPPKDI